MRKTMRRAIRRNQQKALARLNDLCEETFTIATEGPQKGKAIAVLPLGPVAVALGECHCHRAQVDKETLRSLARWGIG